MMAPCSVNASGTYFTFPPRFKITACDLERRASAASSLFKRNAKSGGKCSASAAELLEGNDRVSVVSCYSCAWSGGESPARSVKSASSGRSTNPASRSWLRSKRSATASVPALPTTSQITLGGCP